MQPHLKPGFIVPVKATKEGGQEGRGRMIHLHSSPLGKIQMTVAFSSTHFPKCAIFWIYSWFCMLRARLPPAIFKETGRETSSLFSLADRQGSVTRTEVEVCSL